ncbi:MAG TPA: DUF5615 family PIN-like protein [Candidatus Dormibacteraeota bacterium]
MRLLLDAQLSGRVIGRHLRTAGHDVLALGDQRDYEGIDDAAVLELASREGRVLITHNVKDFPDILREWAEAGHHHAGCMIIVGVALNEFGELTRVIDAALAALPEQGAWRDHPLFVARFSR